MPIDDPFVGRADELALLNAEMQRVRSGEPRLVWLTGEAGIGKTSLVRRFIGGLSGVRVLWAGGDENETDLPYGVINQLLSDLLASDTGSGLAALRPDSDPLAVGADLLSELGALQTSGPVLVVIDDAQWADHRSAQALVFVARRLRSDQVMILLSSRSNAPDPRQLWERALAQSQLTRRLPLGGLTAEDLRRLSSSFDGVLLSPAASRRLHEHTGGHPLYARALLEELPAEALMEASDALPAPHSMSFVVLVRLAKLSPAAQDLVLAAAVVLGEGTGVIRNKHEGPGVLPGRYAGEAIPIHDGPTPQQVAYEQHKVAADGLAGRICAAAADAARSQYILLELIGEFDAMGGL